jgi:hypothetical protein
VYYNRFDRCLYIFVSLRKRTLSDTGCLRHQFVCVCVCVCVCVEGGANLSPAHQPTRVRHVTLPSTCTRRHSQSPKHCGINKNRAMSTVETFVKLVYNVCFRGSTASFNTRLNSESRSSRLRTLPTLTPKIHRSRRKRYC